MSTFAGSIPRHTLAVLHGFYQLCKPRVTALIVFTAVIGMLLAAPGLAPLPLLLAAGAGIAMASGAAAALNCLIEHKIDAAMARTRVRPLPSGRITRLQAAFFAALLGSAGLWVLYRFVNPLTMWLTFGALFGYGVVYTVFLKPATPMNIVIGGAAGAMPPVLGWAAVSDAVAPEAWILFLIIFAWTPPHFWSLALYRRHEYARAGIPMLPVTHGEAFTCLHILLYTVILVTVSFMPYASGMSGPLYLLPAVALDGRFLWLALRLYRNYSGRLAHRTFRYSITYLASLFAVLLADHYARLS